MWIMRKRNVLTFNIDFTYITNYFTENRRNIALMLYKLTVNANIKMAVDFL